MCFGASLSAIRKLGHIRENPASLISCKNKGLCEKTPVVMHEGFGLIVRRERILILVDQTLDADTPDPVQ